MEDYNYSNDLGHSIRELREEHGISQESFAELVGVSRRTIISWEQNSSSPRADFLKIICDKFNVDITYFYPDTKINSELAATADDHDLISHPKSEPSAGNSPLAHYDAKNDRVLRRLRNVLLGMWLGFFALILLGVIAITIYFKILDNANPDGVNIYYADVTLIILLSAILLVMALLSVMIYQCVKYKRNKKH